ncbi:hypothetical protein GQ53DRAFT_743503 [Thozetella sp. PMI_491]|nr:hypothetical protein GQ53DRAFT_743503 [Thozetella sp. PMI_491]
MSLSATKQSLWLLSEDYSAMLTTPSFFALSDDLTQNEGFGTGSFVVADELLPFDGIAESLYYDDDDDFRLQSSSSDGVSDSSSEYPDLFDTSTGPIRESLPAATPAEPAPSPKKRVSEHVRYKRRSNVDATRARKRTKVTPKPAAVRDEPDSHSSSESGSPQVGAALRRHSHNHVEKQYRNRLKWEFEQLLALLPDSNESHNADDRAGGSPTKAMVLIMARQRIRELEEQLRTSQDRITMMNSFGSSSI